MFVNDLQESGDTDSDSDSEELVSRAWVGRVCIVAAALLWSSGGFFAKAPIFNEWPADQRPFLLTFWRALFAAAFLLIFVRRPTWNWRLIPMAITFAAMSLSYMASLVYAEATLAIWLQYTSPIWVLLVGVWIFREKAKSVDLLFLSVALSGVAWIVLSQLNGQSGLGLWFGLLSGLFFGLVVLQLRHLKELDATWLIFINQLAATLAAAPFVFSSAESHYPIDEQWFYLAAFGILQMGIPYVLFARGLKSVNSHEASGILLLEPLLVPLWVYVAWRNAESYEYPRVSTVIGGSLILASLVIRYGYEIKKFRCKRSHPAAETK